MYPWHSCGMMMWFVWIPVVILAVWLLIKVTGTGKQQERANESPLDVLKRRYANGDITTEEYQTRKRTLEGS